MSVPLSAAQRVSRARRAKTARRPHVCDPCPSCAVDLGGAGQVTRRIALSSPHRGSFLWECPSCRSRWSEPCRTRATATA